MLPWLPIGIALGFALALILHALTGWLKGRPLPIPPHLYRYQVPSAQAPYILPSHALSERPISEAHIESAYIEALDTEALAYSDSAQRPYIEAMSARPNTEAQSHEAQSAILNAIRAERAKRGLGQ